MKRNLLTITAMMLVLILAMSAVSVGAAVDYSDKVNLKGTERYADKVLPQLLEDYMWDDIEEKVNYYELYRYYSSDNSGTEDEATPDYVLIYFDSVLASEMPVAHVMGEYLMEASYRGIPFTYGYGIYIPSSDEVYNLPRAYALGIEGIESVFTEAGVGSLIGDMDSNRVLNVKDATLIQKCLAGIEKFDPYDYIFAAEFDDTLPLYSCDFNRDHKRDIKDATAIQKHIAGLEYM